MPQIIEYKCPCCGGIIEFDATLQQMKCPYCDTTFDPAALLQMDQELNNPKPDDMQWQTPEDTWGADEPMNLYSCKSCGGEIIADENTGATHCPFCGNPVVLVSRFAGALKPDYVIPFQLDKQAAKDKLRTFLRGKKLLPRLFSTENHLDEIKGVYVPFWLFDTTVDADINYHATRMRSWRSGNREYTETSHFRVQRGGDLTFDRIPVDGSSQMDDTMMESLEPFDFTGAKPFQTAYLSGYFADKYDVGSEESKERVNARVKQTTENAFRGTVSGYGTVAIESSSLTTTHSQVKYAMYPVWLLNTTYMGKHYQFAMNGQTGKFIGDLPVGKKEYWMWHLIWTGIFAAGGYLLLLLWMLMM